MYVFPYLLCVSALNLITLGRLALGTQLRCRFESSALQSTRECQWSEVSLQMDPVKDETVVFQASMCAED